MSFAVVLSKFSNTNYNLVGDFLGDLQDGETITGATATASTWSGVDLSPSDLLSGASVISASQVSQVLTGGVAGAIYLVTLQATTSLVNILQKQFFIPVDFSDTTADNQLTTTYGGSPIASFTSVVTGLSVAFTDTSTDAGGTISSWKWDFGDGSTSTSQNPSHTYAATNTFPVTLTIEDSYSGVTSSVTNNVVISPAAGGLVSPLGFSGKTYNTYKISASAAQLASLTFVLTSGGTWHITNSSGGILDSGNWYNPPVADIGATFTGKFTPTLSVTGSHWTLTNPAAAATSLASDLTLVLKESATFTSPDSDITTGTIKVDFAGAATGTGTFSFNVSIERIDTT